jgi:hypothetical protein
VRFRQTPSFFWEVVAGNHDHYLHGTPRTLTSDHHFEQAGFQLLLR